MNIVIIGAGQLGSRHLQALALLKEKIIIYLIDPSDKSLETSKKRFDEVDLYKNKQLYLFNSIAQLPTTVEFAIISTTSLHRLSALKDLLEHSCVKYLLLEKFLFPYVEQYEEAKQLIEKTNTITYVNCARRHWDSYQNLKEMLSNTKTIHLNVKGQNWNLASNAIHFLDLFFYLSGERNIQLNTDQLMFTEGKHKGYVEFLGKLTGETDNGNKLELNCAAGENIEILIEVVTDIGVYRINEAEQTIIINDMVNKFNIYNQSQITNEVFTQLKETDRCDLTSFNEAIETHLLLLNGFNLFLGNHEGIVT